MLGLQEAYREGRLSKLDYAYAMSDKLAVLNEIPALLSRSEVESITVTGSHVVFTFKGSGLRMACDPADRGNPSVVTWLYGLYEKAEIEMFLALVKPGACFLDVGANQGWFGLQVAKKDPGNRVFCFEPVPPTYGYLMRNIQENQLTNIQAWNFGLLDEEGERTFALDPLHMGAASLGNSRRAHPCDMPVPYAGCRGGGKRVGSGPHQGRRGRGRNFRVQGRQGNPGEIPAGVVPRNAQKTRADVSLPSERHHRASSPLGYGCFTCVERILRPFDEMTEETVETNSFSSRSEHAALLEPVCPRP